MSKTSIARRAGGTVARKRKELSEAAIATSTDLDALKATAKVARARAKAIETVLGKRGAHYDEMAADWIKAVRCDRRLGVLCAEIAPLNKGGRPKKTTDTPSGVSLADLDITHAQSSRWQRLARVPEDDFEEYVRATKEKLGELTMAGLLAAHAGGGKLGQWDTPAAVARRMVGWLELAGDAPRILEPSAGTGVLVRAALALYPRAQIDAVELDPERCELLEAIEGVNVVRGDYLEHASGEAYDAIITNPPFTKGADASHLATMLDDARRIVALLPSRSLHGDERFRHVWRRMGVDWWLRRKAHLVTRPKFEGDGGTDEIVIVRLDREPGECLVEWWELEARADEGAGADT